MTAYFFIEPGASTAPETGASPFLKDTSLEQLRQLVLAVPGVEKIYPRPSHWLRAVGGARGASMRSQRLATDQVTVAVRLGVSSQAKVPEVARAVSLALANALPEVAIELEVASC